MYIHTICMQGDASDHELKEARKMRGKRKEVKSRLISSIGDKKNASDARVLVKNKLSLLETHVARAKKHQMERVKQVNRK